MRTTTILLLALFALSSCTETIIRTLPGQDFEFGPIEVESDMAEGITNQEGLLFIWDQHVMPGRKINIALTGENRVEVVQVLEGGFSVQSHEPNQYVHFTYSILDTGN